MSSFPPCNLLIPNSWCRVTFQARKYGIYCLLQRNKLDFLSWKEKTSRRKTWKSFDMKCQSLGITSLHYTQQEEEKKKNQTIYQQESGTQVVCVHLPIFSLKWSFFAVPSSAFQKAENGFYFIRSLCVLVSFGKFFLHDKSLQVSVPGGIRETGMLKRIKKMDQSPQSSLLVNAEDQCSLRSKQFRCRLFKS